MKTTNRREFLKGAAMAADIPDTPETWRDEHKLFSYQVGFTCPPFDYDAAPSDFLRMAPETVGVHGWMLHVPDYVHGLDQRKANFGMICRM